MRYSCCSTSSLTQYWYNFFKFRGGRLKKLNALYMAPGPYFPHSWCNLCVRVSRYVRACQHHAYGFGAKWISGAEASIPLQATLGLKAAYAGITQGRQHQLRQRCKDRCALQQKTGCLGASSRLQLASAIIALCLKQCFIKALQRLHCQLYQRKSADDFWQGAVSHADWLQNQTYVTPTFSLNHMFWEGGSVHPLAAGTIFDFWPFVAVLWLSRTWHFLCASVPLHLWDVFWHM